MRTKSVFSKYITPTSDCEVLLTKEVDGSCWVRTHVELVGQTVRNFSWCPLNLLKSCVNTGYVPIERRPYGWHSPYLCITVYRQSAVTSTYLIYYQYDKKVMYFRCFNCYINILAIFAFCYRFENVTVLVYFLLRLKADCTCPHTCESVTRKIYSLSIQKSSAVIQQLL